MFGAGNAFVVNMYKQKCILKYLCPPTIQNASKLNLFLLRFAFFSKFGNPTYLKNNKFFVEQQQKNYAHSLAHKPTTLTDILVHIIVNSGHFKGKLKLLYLQF